MHRATLALACSLLVLACGTPAGPAPVGHCYRNRIELVVQTTREECQSLCEPGSGDRCEWETEEREYSHWPYTWQVRQILRARGT